MKVIKLICLACIVFYTMLLGACSHNEKVATSDHFDVVDLPDGSIVYLNHNSSIEYEQGLPNRTVEMSGEAFFDVVESDVPFIVRTPHGEVKVLGTEFNVRAQTDELEVEVEEGVVELKTTVDNQKIKRGEQGVWKKGGKTVRKAKAKMRFHVWLNTLEREFKQIGKEIKRGTREARKESGKAAKELKQELKKIKKELK